MEFNIIYIYKLYICIIQCIYIYIYPSIHLYTHQSIDIPSFGYDTPSTLPNPPQIQQLHTSKRPLLRDFVDVAW